MHRHLLATVTTPGEMGTVTNWQQHLLPMLSQPGEELAKLLGKPLPADAMPASAYPAPPRFVPTVRTTLAAGEALALEVIMLGRSRAMQVACTGGHSAGASRVALEHVSGGVYRATLPAEAVKGDFEYYVEAAPGAARCASPLRRS